MTIQFENMTEDEQKAWWLEQAKILLTEYNMPDAEVSWLAYTHNAVMKVVHEQGHFVLRLQDMGKLPNVESEFTILKQLFESNIEVPKPVQVMDVPKSPIVGLLLSHLEGAPFRLAERVIRLDMISIGLYLAKMHNVPIKAENRPNLDYNGLFGETGVYRLNEEAKQVFTDEQLTVMDAAAEKVKAAMDELGTGENEFGLIHGDLLLQNILFHEGEVRALDFEYCGWGYYLYDLTPLLWQLKPQARYPELEQALWNGYTVIRPLSSRHRELLETFIAGRQVASMRWVAANRHNPSYQGKVEGIMVQRAAELQGFLDTGILKRQ
jgi:Ser/Thr protein kinase RdoA (MazF antagonist)